MPVETTTMDRAAVAIVSPDEEAGLRSKKHDAQFKRRSSWIKQKSDFRTCSVLLPLLLMVLALQFADAFTVTCARRLSLLPSNRGDITVGQVDADTQRKSRTVLYLANKKTKSKKKANRASPASRGGGGGFGGFASASDAKTTAATGASSSAATTAAATAASTTTSFRGTGSGVKAMARATNNYDRLREAHGAKACRDVYVRSPLNCRKTFWFVGKIVHDVDALDDDDAEADDGAPTTAPATTNAVPVDHQVAIAQKRLILEYAKDQLRPQNMGGKFASALELWLAPPDSEMDVVQNKVSLEKVKGSSADLLPSLSSAAVVGFHPEIYVGEEKTEGGLRVERDERGHPVNPVFEANMSM